MKHLTQDDLDAIADKLNNRPRKVLDYDTPANKLRALLHSSLEFTDAF
jgi:IS30 family transposase